MKSVSDWTAAETDPAGSILRTRTPGLGRALPAVCRWRGRNFAISLRGGFRKRHVAPVWDGFISARVPASLLKCLLNLYGTCGPTIFPYSMKYGRVREWICDWNATRRWFWRRMFPLSCTQLLFYSPSRTRTRLFTQRRRNTRAFTRPVRLKCPTTCGTRPGKERATFSKIF